MSIRNSLAALLCGAATAHPVAAGADSLELDIPMVLTPVRLKQPRTEVPASVTVIDRTLIEASGIRELPDILRLVPGMAVAARDGWHHVVSYHGTSYRDSRRMQVLVDGRSVYQAGLATIDWNDIPLAVEEIERIEIVRGPNTAAYGANAFLGIINIITRHPQDSPRLRLKASAGTESVEDYYGGISGTWGESSFRLSASERRDSGFDRNAAGATRRDSKNLQFINARWNYSPNENWNLELQGGYKTGTYLEDITKPSVLVPGLAPLTMETSPDINVKDYFVSLNAQHFFSPTSSFEWQLDFARQRERIDWFTCLPALFLGFNDFDVICGTTNENGRNQRIDLDLQHTLLGSAPWKLVYGLHLKQMEVSSQTFYGGDVDSESYQLFANVEYRFLPKWSATLGGSQEYQSGQGDNFSPRAALLFFPAEGHSFRAVYSEAVRTPDLFETEAYWSYQTKDLVYPDGTPYATRNALFQQLAQAPDNLREERIRSRELGYYGNWWQHRLEVDLKWFWDDLDDLISKQLVFDNFTPANNSWVEQQGYEAEVNLQAHETLRLRATFALINSDTNNPREEDLTPRHSGSAGIIYSANRWQLSSFYYRAHDMNDREFSRLDLRVAHRFPLFGSELTISGVVQHYYNYREGELFGDNRYDDSNRAFVSMELAY
jgi:iron complex outermembrane receptor protein